MVDNDSTVLWTYERMMEKTLPYCVWVKGVLPGWWLSEEAMEAMVGLVCLN